MCATRHSANAVTTSGPDKQASWLFDLQDHQLIQLVNSFVAARNMSMSLAQPEEGLHPRGIIKLTTDPGMRIAAPSSSCWRAWRPAVRRSACRPCAVCMTRSSTPPFPACRRIRPAS